MSRKYIITALLLLFICFNSYSQVHKYRAKQFAAKSKDSYGRWTKWSDWETCDILIVINLEKDVVTIYSKKTQEFDIVKVYDSEKDNEGFEVFKLLVVDENGLRCNIRHRFAKTEYFDSQLYIDYADFMYVYNLVPN